MKRLPCLPILGLTLASFLPSVHAQTIPKGNLVVDLVSFAVLPNSGGSHLPARANDLVSAPGGRLFANDQRGILYTISADGKTVAPFLNLPQYVPLLSDDGERGFQSFAFHPQFATPGAAGFGKFYTVTSQTDTGRPATFTPGVAGAGHDHDEVLLEWTVADPNAAAFTPANAAQPFREVLRIARPNSNHDGGYLSFNPTAALANAEAGNLYYGMGDSGGGGDPLGLAQMAGNAYGAILRINPLLPAANAASRSANGQYSIPADNPYTANPALLKEKYAGGFRNPQRFTWDRANGRFFIADIGQNNVEEIDLGIPGANYGWNLREGSLVYNSNGSVGANARADAATTGLTYPIAEFRHFGSVGNAVTIGPAYRNPIIPALNGRLLFCDFVTGTPYTVDANNLPSGGSDSITELRLRSNGTELSFLSLIQQTSPGAARADLRFSTDAADNVYFLNKRDGIIRRVVTTPPVVIPPPTVGLSVSPATVSRRAGQVGLVTITRTGPTVGDLVVPYTVGGTAVAGQDYVMLRGTRKIRAGRSATIVKIIPLPGGKNGKVSIALPPGDGYTVDPNARKVKVLITD